MEISEISFLLEVQIGCKEIFLGVVEAVFPIEDPKLFNSVLKDLELILADNENASVLKSNGSYSKIKRNPRVKNNFLPANTSRTISIQRNYIPKVVNSVTTA